MCGVRLIGVGRLTLSMEKMAWVNVGLDNAQPNLRAARLFAQSGLNEGLAITRSANEHAPDFQAKRAVAATNERKVEQ